MTDALGAFFRVDDIDFIPFADGFVRAFRLANVAVNAIIGND
tara:strand:- start:2816 stop:2941 length:126 start_codon:yes stop_codon:yes gene_type:complete